MENHLRLRGYKTFLDGHLLVHNVMKLESQNYLNESFSKQLPILVVKAFNLIELMCDISPFYRDAERRQRVKEIHHLLGTQEGEMRAIERKKKKF